VLLLSMLSTTGAQTATVAVACCPQVVLVVIDSVTFHFRQDWPDMGRRARLLAAMAQQAMSVAETRGVAMVYMNQVGARGMICMAWAG
jgi:RecA/RadA recombinase